MSNRRWNASLLGVRAALAILVVLLAAWRCVASAGASIPLASTAGIAPDVSVSTPGASVSVPSVGISTPVISVSTPSVGASTSDGGVTVSGGETLPSVDVTTPSVNASLPGATVSTPGASVSTPSVNVSVPSAGVSVPGAGVSVPSGGETGAPSAPAASGPSSPPRTGAVLTPPHETKARAAATHDPVATTAAASKPVTPTSRTAPGASLGRSEQRARTLQAHRSRATSRNRSPGARPGGAPGFAAAGRSAPTGPGGRSTSRPTAAGASNDAGNVLDSIGRRIPLPIPVPDWSRPIILALALLVIAFALRAAMSGARARRLQRQQTRLLRDLDVVQAALVPAVPMHMGGLALSVAYRPADGPAAGGDFYDVFTTKENKVAIILGDVSGHGHEALTHAALTRYTLRAYVQAGLSPREALALAGRALSEPTIEHYATVIVAIYDDRDGQLTYASAGHPPPIVQWPGADAPLTVCCSPPVGWSVPTGLRQTTITLPAGAVVCFFSDGLIEARCGSDLLGTQRLSDMLTSIGERPDAARLLERVRKTATATPDDMAACIVAVEAGGETPHVHVEEAEVDARLLDGTGVARLLEGCRVPGDERARVIARARTLAGASGTALLRIDRAAASATVTACAEDGQSPAEPRRRPRAIERRLPTHALSGGI